MHPSIIHSMANIRGASTMSLALFEALEMHHWIKQMHNRCITESLCCTVEISTALHINYPSIKNNFLKKQTGELRPEPWRVDRFGTGLWLPEVGDGEGRKGGEWKSSVSGRGLSFPHLMALDTGTFLSSSLQGFQSCFTSRVIILKRHFWWKPNL